MNLISYLLCRLKTWMHYLKHSSHLWLIQGVYLVNVGNAFDTWNTSSLNHHACIVALVKMFIIFLRKAQLRYNKSPLRMFVIFIAKFTWFCSLQLSPMLGMVKYVTLAVSRATHPVLHWQEGGGKAPKTFRKFCVLENLLVPPVSLGVTLHRLNQASHSIYLLNNTYFKFFKTLFYFMAFEALTTWGI